MKTIKNILIVLSVSFLLASCYGKDYIMDYDYSAAYVAYQYDLRTFIPGEDVQVGFFVGLAGVVDNNRDRKVGVEIDNSLLSSNLAVFDPKGEAAAFTALDGLKGSAPLGALSQGYVSDAFNASGLESLEALPESYYTTSKVSGLAIEKGRHTAEVRITPTEEMFKDSKILKPCYALAFKVNTADVDSLIREKSFQIMAVKVENRFYGNWYHGGRTRTIKNSTGATLSEDTYSREAPQSDGRVYVLTTETVNSVTTNKIGNENGSLRLTFDADNNVKVEDVSGKRDIRAINGQPSRFNGAKLIQDREIYLSYAWSNGDGTTTYVTDTIAFRNRIRDGINEWQDENTQNY